MLSTKLIGQLSRKMPLYLILVASFGVQILVIVGLTGWFSWQRQQKTLEKVAVTLQTQGGDQIEKLLQQQLNAPKQASQALVDAISLNLLPPQEKPLLQAYRQKQLKSWPSIRDLQIDFSQGKNGSEKPETAWQVNLDQSSLILQQPLYTNNQQFLGMIKTEVSLAEIGQWFQDLNLETTGSLLILDRQGKVIINGTKDQEIVNLINQIKDKLNNLHQVTTRETYTLKFNDQNYFISVQPFQDNAGLDWLIILMLREDQLKAIAPNDLPSKIILGVISLLLILGLGKITSDGINQPILKLIKITNALSQGRWNPTLLVDYEQEIGTCQETVKLVEAFNQMRQQLQESFVALERAKVELENRVEERTKALRNANKQLREEILERQQANIALRYSETKFRNLFENSQVGIFRIRLEDGLFENMNQRCLEILGYQNLDQVVGQKTFQELYIDPELHQTLLEQLQFQGEIRNFELQFYRSDQTLIWVLFSAHISLEEGYLQGVITDISERKQAEETLRETENILRKQNNILLNLAKNKNLYQGDLELAFNIFTEVTAETLGIERVGIWLYNEEHSLLQSSNIFDQTINQHFQEISLTAQGYPSYFQAIESDRVLAVNNVYEDPRSQELIEDYFKPSQIFSMLDAPIRLGGHIVGLLCLETTNQTHQWTVESQNFAASIADLISLAIEAQRTKQTEITLRKREQQYRDLVQTVNSIIIRLDPSGNIKFINDYGQQFFGYSEVQILGKNVIGSLIAENEQSEKRLKLLIKDISKRPHRYLSYEIEHTRENGQQVWVSWANKPLFDEQGKLVEILSVGTDLTDRKKAEQTLKEKEEYLRIILDNIPQQVFWKNTDLVFLGCNKNWAEAAYLKSPEEVIGKTDFELLPDPQVAEFFRQQDRKIIEDNIPQLHFIAKKQRPAPDGSAIWLDISKIPIHDSQGNVIGIVGVLEDITQRKLAEEALQLEQAKSEALLLNILPKAIADKLKEDQREHIAEHFDQITILFADIVGFTPLSSQMSPTELVKILNKIFSTFDQLAEKHGLEKIKTIGDAYMIVGGLPLAREDHAEAIAQIALDMQEAIRNFDDYSNLKIRIGINTGSVVAGVIGIKKFSYDLWGDTVNVASRMESQGEPGKIQVTAATYQHLKDKFIFEERGEIEVKGKGKMTTYWLLGKKFTE